MTKKRKGLCMFFFYRRTGEREFRRRRDERDLEPESEPDLERERRRRSENR